MPGPGIELGTSGLRDLYNTCIYNVFTISTIKAPHYICMYIYVRSHILCIMIVLHIVAFIDDGELLSPNIY